MSDLETDETLQSLAEQCRLECERAEKAEAERDEWKQAAEVEAGLRREFKAKRDAIEAKTIEGCIKAVWDAGGDNTEWHCDAIRAKYPLTGNPYPYALKPSEEGRHKDNCAFLRDPDANCTCGRLKPSEEGNG